MRISKSVLGACLVAVLAVYGFTSRMSQDDQVARGRAIVISNACGDCHGGGANAASPDWLTGLQAANDSLFPVGPFLTRPSNLTPDNETGLGAVSERQIFNALRYGLRTRTTADVTITSTTPGVGNFPKEPHYLPPSMPWAAWRHMPDEDLRAIAAYLKRGLKPVAHAVKPSDGPPDFWASESTPEKLGPYPALPYPTSNEVPGLEKDALVQRGRLVVLRHDCGGCHQGGANPAAPGFLAGITKPDQGFHIGPFATRPRNITPDNTTGIGRFTERQIFNSLRYGLRPGETPDMDITSVTPGQGNHPANPKYLAPPMPWPSWRHLPDSDLWAVAAYLKRGVKPVKNRVADSEGPPDFWASEMTPEKIGVYPAPKFPTAQERLIRN